MFTENLNITRFEKLGSYAIMFKDNRIVPEMLKYYMKNVLGCTYIYTYARKTCCSLETGEEFQIKWKNT